MSQSNDRNLVLTTLCTVLVMVQAVAVSRNGTLRMTRWPITINMPYVSHVPLLSGQDSLGFPILWAVPTCIFTINITTTLDFLFLLSPQRNSYWSRLLARMSRWLCIPQVTHSEETSNISFNKDTSVISLLKRGNSSDKVGLLSKLRIYWIWNKTCWNEEL
jgi:hypothetical protein